MTHTDHHADHAGHHRAEPEDPTQFWEQHYGQRDQIWSGHANAGLVARVKGMAPGRALDLGCGEGGDAVWLAQQGWQVTAVDISQTALGRARSLAQRAGVGSAISFERHSLGESFPAGTFDLVSLQFLQSPVDLPAETILRQAAAAVAPDGFLLVTYHGAIPPWSDHEEPEGGFPSPQETWASTGAAADDWTVVEMGLVEREATRPDGQTGVLIDAVVLARRR